MSDSFTKEFLREFGIALGITILSFVLATPFAAAGLLAIAYAGGWRPF